MSIFPALRFNLNMLGQHSNPKGSKLIPFEVIMGKMMQD